MEKKQELVDEQTKAQMQKWATRQASITGAAVVVGFGMAQATSEGMAGQPVWLRVLVSAIVAGIAAGIFAVLVAKFWRQ